MEELSSDHTIMFVISFILTIGFVYFVYLILTKVNSIISETTKLPSLLSYLILGVLCVFNGDYVNSLIKSLYSFATFPLLENKQNNSIIIRAVNEVESGNYQLMIGENLLGIGAVIATWSLVCWLVSITKNYVANQITKNPTIDLFDLYMTKAFLITFFFVTAMFLVISSIVAVPEFQSIQTNITFDKLEQEFDAEIIKRFNSTQLPDLSFDTKRAHQRLDSVILARKEALTPEQVVMQSSTDDLALEYNSLNERFFIFKENQRPALVYAYIKEMLSGLSERNRNAYKSELINASLKQTYTIVQKMQGIKSRLTLWYSNAESGYFYPISKINSSIEREGVVKAMIIKPPKATDPSIGLGIFGFMSNWLLKTRSISLALIVGMFGFGLLGAIASSFVKQRMTQPNPTKKSTKQIVEDIDIRTILITGVTAAVIIFLSVKGALVVLTTAENSASINPYILFFICFSASLYNEIVWNWVVARFTAYLNTPPAPAPNGGGAAPSPGVGTPAPSPATVGISASIDPI